jgi:hypothetical protein
MSLTMLLTIFIVVYILTIGIMIVRWRELAEKWVGNDVNKGRLLIDYGSDVKAYNSKLFYQNEKGDYYSYKLGKEPMFCFQPMEYGQKYNRGRRLMALMHGEVICMPLWGDVVPEDLKKDSASLVSRLAMGKLAFEMIGEISGNKMGMFIWIIIIAVMTMVGFAVYKYFGKGSVAVPPVVPTPTPENIPEAVKAVMIWLKAIRT